ncbi:hypothetical protein [Falsirhodobacter algicola]|uniref:Uncharacterized protein n=1 Tax=Falsirhodobacter algicola TaxID=2692330 RepID=A0A8J8MTL5_9RHOB|nr:hypothetical protein [Falsirhodobacter algicola]QUS36083.1 hypothetical protein GR316_07255 [Falsirhodobacter algicola]
MTIDFTKVITAEARERERRQEAQDQAQAEARALLTETDWMVIRAAECGTPLPEAIRDARAGARAVLSDE